MDIRVRALDYTMTKAISNYLDERIAAIEKLVGKDAETTRCEVELGRAAGNQRHGDYLWFAEFQIIRPKGKRVVARNHESTLNAAIDGAKDEAMRQLRKLKTVTKSKVRKDAGRGKRIAQSR